MPELEDQAVELLQQLIRANTVNPPGNEREVQELLAGRLGDAGFECELLGENDERPNLVARLPGSGKGRRCACWATPTPCWPIPTTGPTTPGRATWPTAACGGAARWT